MTADRPAGFASSGGWRDFGSGPERLCRATALLLAVLILAVSVAAAADAAANPGVGAGLAVWDTGTPLGDRVDLGARTGWARVPTDLLKLEANPAKASADPGYYGRPYAFNGDAVVENSRLTAVLMPSQGRFILHAKALGGMPTNAIAPDPRPGRPVVEVVPLGTAPAAAAAPRCELAWYTGDQVVLALRWGGETASAGSVRFSFDKTEIVEIRPDPGMAGVRVLGPFAYGVVPSFIADDLILDPAAHPAAPSLAAPAENAWLGLLPGEDALLEMTWPPGRQRLDLPLGADAQGRRHIRAVDLATDGHSVYLAAVRAPGIWHREALKPSYIEKETRIPWRRPFPARWRTQLTETDTRTTFAFRDAPGSIWRGVAGSYDYPAWFEGDQAVLRLTKKVPPKGEALIYFLEGQDTPDWILTPADMLKATLGRPLADTLIDLSGRSLRTHHRRGAEGVRRACTCGCTEAIQAMFDAGQPAARAAEIGAATDDMLYFVGRHLARIEEYQRFANELLERLATNTSQAPALKAFADRIAALARQIPQECSAQEGNMKSLAYAHELRHQTLALTARDASINPAALKRLMEDWRAMGGAQDYVLASCHVIARRVFMEAGLAAAEQPAAVDLAVEVRSRCRQCLRNPDGYEIWPNY